jgi:peptide/nickel transport system permease protein
MTWLATLTRRGPLRSGMVRYVLGRLFSSVAVLFVLSLIVFAMVRFMPGDPTAGFFDTRSAPSPEDLAALRARLGLDRPWYAQYLSWIGGILHGDFGSSITNPYQVGAQIAQRLPLSAELAFMATGISLLVGIPLGLIGGAKAGSLRDGAVRATAFVFISTPEFLLAIFLVLLNSRTVQWRLIGAVRFSDNAWDNIRLMLTPAIVLGIGLGAYISRYVRSGLIDDLERPYVRTLRAIGTPQGVIARHSLRNAMIPVTTVVAVSLGSLVGGTVVIEKIFAIPGMGAFLMDSIQHTDYPSIQGAILVIGAIYLIMNLLVDLVYPFIDPRVRVAAA